VEHTRKNPHVLYGPSLQGPREVDFSSAVVPRTVCREDARCHVPAAYEPAVKTQLFSPIGGWACGTERSDKFCGVGHGSLARDDEAMFNARPPWVLGKIATLQSMATSPLLLASGCGWRVHDVRCTSGPQDRPFEEQ